MGIVAIDAITLETCIGIKNTPNPEESFTHDELWAMTEDAIAEAGKAIRGEEHSTLPSAQGHRPRGCVTHCSCTSSPRARRRP